MSALMPIREGSSMRFSQKLKENRGVAVMLITVTVLILATLILIYAFQNSSIGLLIGKNLLDKAGAVKNAQACEQVQVADILGVNGPVPPLNGATINPPVTCSSNVPVSLGLFFPVGYSGNIHFTRMRLTSQGTD